ncbi:MAG: Ig-like domain-containing protein [Aureispira sp.]|nr:Ig-like domain-containing protein [Aureispira sp.]
MNKKGILHWGISILGLWLAISCATPRAPEGGPNDKKAPEFHSKRYSTPDKMTNFAEKEVILTFDEWVKLVQAQQKIIISPPLQERPDIKIKNKSVVVKFKEDLKPNTTYTISFADVVQDITENNAVENLKRVFSTGAFLDSLTVGGEIVDARSSETKKNVWVMLYDNLDDSVIYKEKPYYVAKVDEQGRFLLENIKNDTFKIVALDDQNNNFLFDQVNESIAFLDTTFVLSDSVQPAFRLRMFQEEGELTLTSKSSDSYGTAGFYFNHPHDDRIEIAMLDAPSDLVQYWEYGKDSIRLWFDGTMPKEDWQFELRVDGEPIDTAKIVATERDVFMQEVVALNTIEVPNKKTKLQHPKQPITLEFNRPIKNIDSILIEVKQRIMVSVEDTVLVTIEGDTLLFSDPLADSIKVDTAIRTIQKDSFAKIILPKYTLDSQNIRSLDVYYDWVEEMQYQISLKAGAVQDIYGLSNEDTLNYYYDVNVIEEYGNIEADIINMDSTMQYVVQLIEGKDEKLIRDTIILAKDSIHLNYPYQEVGNYTIRIIHDQNKNGRWDVGAYMAGMQPENISNSKLIQLTAGWDNEMLIDLTPKDQKKRRGIPSFDPMKGNRVPNKGK